MRQKGLFPGVPLVEEELERLISPLYPRLWRMIREPFEDLRGRRGSDPGFRVLDEGETAQWLRPQIVECARRIFEDDPQIIPRKKNQQFYLEWCGKFAIIPKKLRSRRGKSRLTFSSYNTVQNLNLWAQRAEDGLPDLPRLLVGYVFVDQMTDIKIWVAYPRGKSAGVYLLMPDQVGGIKGVYQPAPDEGEPEDDKGFRVRPRRARGLPESEGS